MAIVKMKKLRVMAMADKQEILLRELQKLGCVEISEPDDKLADPEWSSLLKRGTSNLSETRTEITDVNAALTALKRYAQLKDGLFIQRKPVSQQDFLNLSGNTVAREISSQICGHLQKITKLQGDAAKLEISPVPDTLIRVFMTFKPLDQPVDIEPQTLTAPERTGFTVVEWGGSEVK